MSRNTPSVTEQIAVNGKRRAGQTMRDAFHPSQEPRTPRRRSMADFVFLPNEDRKPWSGGEAAWLDRIVAGRKTTNGRA